MRTKEIKELEYPDAPSGSVTLYNYKEPFMDFKDEQTGEGYGYQGVLLFDKETDKVQRHLCGDWFLALSNHLHSRHNIKVDEYKRKVGLRQSTALIGEVIRNKLIQSGQERFKNLRPGGKHTEEQKEKIRATLLLNTRQTQNETGTCPAQLIERLKKKAEQLGRCPTSREIGFYETLIKVFGTFSEARIVAGLELKERLPSYSNVGPKEKLTRDYFYKVAKELLEKHGRFPKNKDMPGSKMYSWRKYLEFKKGIETELMAENRYELAPTKQDLLLEEIRRFRYINGRNPSTSDFRRGMLSDLHQYYYWFGSFRKAIELAS